MVHAGLLLSALPAGFGLAAVAGEKILPARWPDRRRCLAGPPASGCAAALAIPAPDIVLAPGWACSASAWAPIYRPTTRRS